MQKINLAGKFSQFTEHWSPKIIAELNGQQVKLAKFKGAFVWHQHDDEDEFFLVTKGRLVVELRDGEIVLEQGECVVVPRGVAHRPVAEEEVEVLLFEPASTRNTGEVENERTVPEPERL